MDYIIALDLPKDAQVNQRVPKKLLVEHGAPTAGDKRLINEGIEELRWRAALKPHTVGVPEYRDTEREYLEIAVLSLALRPGAKRARLEELVHRAVPYPVFLVTTQAPDTFQASLIMPRVSMFFGIVIFFYYDDHPPPHFHALYEGLDAQFDLQGNLIQGFLPNKAVRLIQEWALANGEALMVNWERSRKNEPLNWIPPLR
jgi:hypothetical protein